MRAIVPPGGNNGTVVKPTIPAYPPLATASGNPNGTVPITFPGAASGLQAGMGLAGLVAAFVALL